MPPSPRLKVSLDTTKWAELLRSMGFSDGGPHVRFLESPRARGKDWIVHGSYMPAADSIVIHTNLAAFEADKLRYVATEVTKTLLHETRHAWQLRAWGPARYAEDNRKDYDRREKEIDANHFAETNAHTWRGLVRIRRTTPAGGFSKLSRHAAGRMV